MNAIVNGCGEDQLLITYSLVLVASFSQAVLGHG